MSYRYTTDSCKVFHLIACLTQFIVAVQRSSAPQISIEKQVEMAVKYFMNQLVSLCINPHSLQGFEYVTACLNGTVLMGLRFHRRGVVNHLHGKLSRIVGYSLYGVRKQFLLCFRFRGKRSIWVNCLGFDGNRFLSFQI